MERDYNKNRRSFRSERSENRRGYGAEQGERYTAGSVGNRNTTRRFERTSERNNGERRERNFNREKDTYRERPAKFSNRRDYRPSTEATDRQDRTERSERKVLVKRDSHTDNPRRPRIFRPRGEETTGNNHSNYNRPFDRDRKKISGREKEGLRQKHYSKKKLLAHRLKNEDENTELRLNRYISGREKEGLRQKHYSKKKLLAHRLKNEDENTELRLNRYISMGGVCSRRDADELIVAGRVKVNGEVVQTVGLKVRKKDKVEVDDVQIFPEKKVYLVLNKPKDYVTTVEDPLERKTVMALVEGACKERIYPVGRLDRQTTGVLLFTNDGDLAKKLTHPKYDHKKIYHVFLDRVLTEEDFQAIANGVQLEDGFIKADEISYTSPDCTEVGIEIHSGKNRIVRRIFEHFGYQIIKLDRVYFAGITKKNLPRGTWRFLTPKEVTMLKVY